MILTLVRLTAGGNAWAFQNRATHPGRADEICRYNASARDDGRDATRATDHTPAVSPPQREASRTASRAAGTVAKGQGFAMIVESQRAGTSA